MKLTKATTSTGEVHVLEGKTSIAVFEKESDADLFIQAKRAAKAPPAPKNDTSLDADEVERLFLLREKALRKLNFAEAQGYLWTLSEAGVKVRYEPEGLTWYRTTA